MHAKRMDKIATGVLYAISGIIVAILASLILYILVRGLPHVSWHFLTGKSSSYQAGGGIGIQLYNSFFLLLSLITRSIASCVRCIYSAREGMVYTNASIDVTCAECFTDFKAKATCFR